MAPPLAWNFRIRSKMPPTLRATMAPPMTSLWPLRYFVVAWWTRSAPSASGNWRIGVAIVLSHTLTAPAARATAATRAISVTRNIGLDGVSIHTRRVVGRNAACTSSGRMTSTNVASSPQRLMCSESNRAVPE